MPSEEDTLQGDIDQRIKDEVQQPKKGVVTKVYEHQEVDDEWNFHVDVKLGPDNHPRKVPVAASIPDLAAPLRSHNHEDGPDLVLVQYVEDDEENRPIVTNILYNNVDRPPIAREGSVRLRRDSLYAEMAQDGSWARLSKKSESDGSPTAQIAIDEDGQVKMETKENGSVIVESDGSGGINIQTDGNISVSAGGNVVIDEGGTAKPVLTEDAIFEYEDSTISDTSDGSGTETTATKTTTPVSNNETTDVEIQ